MKTLVLTLMLVLGCKAADKPKHGPALTPLVANQLKALAGECEVRAAKGQSTTKELRLCKGRQAMMTIHLDENRNLLELEIGVWAPMYEEAEQLVRLAIQGIVPAPAIAAVSERMKNAKSDPVVIDGVRVDAFLTKAPNENPRYTAVLSWGR